MTWAKFGSEFSDHCAEAGLSDAAFRTHVEALMYCYANEKADLTIHRHLVRRWAGSERYPDAITELVQRGFWEAVGDDWRILHHGDVFRQSLAYQVNERERAKNAMRKRRAQAAEADPTVTPDVTRNTTPNVTRDVRRTQPVSQSDRQKSTYKASEHEHINPTTGEVIPEPWSPEDLSQTTKETP